jgi:hypothetical protein
MSKIIGKCAPLFLLGRSLFLRRFAPLSDCFPYTLMSLLKRLEELSGGRREAYRYVEEDRSIDRATYHVD